ncbi:hypothetical protein GS597_17630 [Synechococcales cyanobacterium C]|uniref:Ysc84 actin-binding domain-containing protein n=1 Tax=Petrachloros mirabilis ULC683 TaxID=2781853 RepID=A0A8K2A1V0_9CYAN|nr:hypothetical protein [Petrachloros mirabilis ULC683]
MKSRAAVALPLAGLLSVTLIAPALADSRQEDLNNKVDQVTRVFEEIMSVSNTRIPPTLLARSEGIIIIQGLVQAGFIFGGRRGSGLMVVRQPDGTWSNPAFVSLTGGSFGLQIGAQSSDIVFVFPNRETLNRVLTSSFNVGGSVSGTAGPVGDSAVDPARGFDNAPVYTYSRSSGLFGGVTLDGSNIAFDRSRNRDFYGDQSITPRAIFTDPFRPTPVVVNSLHEVLRKAEAGTISRY